MHRSTEKIWLIVGREYRARVRQRPFIITTVVMAVLLAGLASAPTFLQAIRSGREQVTAIAVYDAANPAATPDDLATLDRQLRADATTGGEIALIASSGPLDAARDKVSAGTYDGLLILNRNLAGDLTFEYATQSGGRDATAARIQQAASTLAVQDRLTRAGVDPARQAALFAPPAFAVRATKAPAGADARSETERSTNRGIAYVMDILLYTTIIVYGMWVAGGVVEEKSNRVMEIMINAATPTELMAGKVIGIGAAALTQYLCITTVAAASLALQGRLAQGLTGERSGVASLDLAGFTVTAAVAFVAFFLLGFLLYAALFAGAGSLVSRQEDVQQMAMPMNMLVLLSFFAAIYALTNPDKPLARLFSFVPFSSPLVMLTRILVGSPAPWEVALSVLILIASIACFVVLAARLYRIGVLLYGARPSLRSVWRLNHPRVAR